MNPPWTDEVLASMERDYRNHPDVADLIAGVRRVLAVCDGYSFQTHAGVAVTVRRVLAALNDPNGA